MAKFNVVDMNGQHVSEIELSDAVFGITPNEKAVHIAVVNFLANQRQGTQNTKIRMEVSGGGKKPWRQKGTGHARQGSTRAPQWTHGGIVFAPKPRDYSYVLNKKVKRLALKSVLSAKVAEGKLVVIDAIKMDAIKTADFRKFLDAVKVDGKAVVAVLNNGDTPAQLEFQLPVETAKVTDLLADTVGAQEVLVSTEWDRMKVQLPSNYATLLRLE